MAAATLPAPGTEYGPCDDEDCGHRDCTTTRWHRDSVCHWCGDPIGYETRYYRTDAFPTMRDSAGRRFSLVHARCEEEAAERELARAAS